jgi:hypothetical protein
LTDRIEQLEKDTDGSEFAPKPSPSWSLPRTKEGEDFIRHIDEMFANKSKHDPASMILEMQENRIWKERSSTRPERPTVAHQDRSVAHQVRLWLEILKARVDAGQYGPGELRGQTCYMRHFVTYLGEQTPIDAIDEEKWAGYHGHLMHRIGIGDCSPEYGKKLRLMRGRRWGL